MRQQYITTGDLIPEHLAAAERCTQWYSDSGTVSRPIPRRLTDGIAQMLGTLKLAVENCELRQQLSLSRKRGGVQQSKAPQAPQAPGALPYRLENAVLADAKRRAAAASAGKGAGAGANPLVRDALKRQRAGQK